MKKNTDHFKITKAIIVTDESKIDKAKVIEAIKKMTTKMTFRVGKEHYHFRSTN